MTKEDDKKTFHDDDFKVEILKPPFFEKTGKTIDRKRAWEKGYWYGAINLWIIQQEPTPSIVYQQRSPTIGWAPGKLDVSAAEHYENLDTVENSLDNISQEIGVKYELNELTYLGKKLNVGIGTDDTKRNTVNDVYFVMDNRDLEEYKLDEKEVYALCKCPIDELIKVHTINNYSFNTTGIKSDGENTTIEVSSEKFPDNFDNYHFKIVQLAQKFINNEKYLMY